MNTNEDTEVVGFRYLLLLSWGSCGFAVGYCGFCGVAGFVLILLCGLYLFKGLAACLGVLIHGSSHAVGSCSVCLLPVCGLLLLGCLTVLDCLSDSCACSLLLFGRLRA